MCYTSSFWTETPPDSDMCIMPYHNGQTDQLQLYMETLDILQDTLDVYSESTPVMIMGDFNASLPQHNLISNLWYKCRPFNRNSLFLYDFICVCF